METEKKNTISFESVTTGEKMDCEKNQDEFDGDIQKQLTEAFYEELRNFFALSKPFRKEFKMDDPRVQALCTVMDADAEGRITDHILFNGTTNTLLSAEGDIVIGLFIEFKKHMDPETFKDIEKMIDEGVVPKVTKN